MFRYFDLSERGARLQAHPSAPVSGMRRGTFERAGEPSATPSPAPAEPAGDRTVSEPPLSTSKQLAIYAGIVAGVILSSAVSSFQTGKPLNLALSWPVALTAAVVALVLFPQVYEKLRVNTGAPVLVQIGLAVQHGVFWQVLMSAIGRALG